MTGMTGRAVARIDEARCIGCTLCFQACPVDAIIGAAKRMHTVMAELCTGCELCVSPCPVDCIDMLPLPAAEAARTEDTAGAARARLELRRLRLARAERIARKARDNSAQPAPDAKQAVIAAAIERAKARRAGVAAGKTDPPPPRVAATIAAGHARRTPAKKP